MHITAKTGTSSLTLRDNAHHALASVEIKDYELRIDVVGLIGALAEFITAAKTIEALFPENIAEALAPEGLTIDDVEELRSAPDDVMARAWAAVKPKATA